MGKEEADEYRQTSRQAGSNWLRASACKFLVSGRAVMHARPSWGKLATACRRAKTRGGKKGGWGHSRE